MVVHISNDNTWAFNFTSSYYLVFRLFTRMKIFTNGPMTKPSPTVAQWRDTSVFEYKW